MSNDIKFLDCIKRIEIKFQAKRIFILSIEVTDSPKSVEMRGEMDCESHCKALKRSPKHITVF
jgi:hypothetical protein